MALVQMLLKVFATWFLIFYWDCDSLEGFGANAA